LPDGSRIYWFELTGKLGWKARYVKTVDVNETTLSFKQEIYDENDTLAEVHEKYPVDKGHIKIRNDDKTKQQLAVKLLNYLQHKTSLEELVAWAENAFMEGEIQDEDS